MNTKRQKCEIFSRVVGYIRPVSQWNAGKRAEYNDRKIFKTTENISYPKDNDTRKIYE